MLVFKKSLHLAPWETFGNVWRNPWLSQFGDAAGQGCLLNIIHTTDPQPSKELSGLIVLRLSNSALDQLLLCYCPFVPISYVFHMAFYLLEPCFFP